MPPSPTDFEKLGSFYLGRSFDLAAKKRTDDLVLYDSKDLVTHAVCVGMTGSGKTGLCLSLLEEAAIDAIPSIVIDPKGDLSNLLLTFPQLRAEDFRPWVNEEDARKQGVEPDQFAAQQAEMWRKGLADWGQDGARIQRLRDAADFTIYTPGSNAGINVSVLRSFDAPPPEIAEEAELMRERIATTATSLLGLLGIDADPIQSREHILLSSLLGAAWSKQRNLDLPTLIQQIQKPPFQRLGVMELESIYPSKERFGLAMALNNLVASPGFESWMEGEPLDIGAMLHTPQGKPRVSIFSIAHLGDAERMFFVSLLLNQTLGWVRTQSGTSSLRALVYMDEIAGYFPPTANPPSKQPLLTLMKQARAFGVGVVVATQNPVDLDYKGLANAGTWFIGRLQTQRDKDRVLDGLEGASANASARFDRKAVDGMLSQLGSRVFLMNNVHEDEPAIFQTRWALSYLRGPLTRAQIKALMDAKRGGASVSSPSPLPSPATPAASKAKRPEVDTASGEPSIDAPRDAPREAPAEAKSGAAARRRSGATTDAAPAAASSALSAARPVLPPGVPEYFLPLRSAGTSASLVYRPMLLGIAKVYFADAKKGIESEQSVALLGQLVPGPVPLDWAQAEEVELDEGELEHEAAEGVAFDSVPADATRPKSYDAWKKALADALFRQRRLELFHSEALKMVSKPGESERDFKARLQQAVREERDALAEKLRQKFAPKAAALQERIRKAEQQVQSQQQQASAAKMQTAVSFGTALLSAFLGRKAVSASSVGRAATGMRGVGRTMKESGDVSRAEETVEALRQQLAEMEAQFKADVDAAASKLDPGAEELESISLKPKKTDIAVRVVVLAWAPHEVSASGVEERAW
ncbi:MAG: hypothetical protein U0575_03075 [Phycisphaerales bacterium]